MRWTQRPDYGIIHVMYMHCTNCTVTANPASAIGADK